MVILIIVGQTLETAGNEIDWTQREESFENKLIQASLPRFVAAVAIQIIPSNGEAPSPVPKCVLNLTFPEPIPFLKEDSFSPETP